MGLRKNNLLYVSDSVAKAEMAVIRIEGIKQKKHLI